MSTEQPLFYSSAAGVNVRALIPRPNLQQELERWVEAGRVMDMMDRHIREKHFNMGTWLVRNECGTVGCLAGHCGMDEWFHGQGLTIVPATDMRPAEFSVDPEIFFGSGAPILYTRKRYGEDIWVTVRNRIHAHIRYLNEKIVEESIYKQNLRDVS